MDMNDANNGDEDMTDDEAAAYCAAWDADAASQQAEAQEEAAEYCAGWDADAASQQAQGRN